MEMGAFCMSVQSNWGTVQTVMDRLLASEQMLDWLIYEWSGVEPLSLLQSTNRASVVLINI